MAEPRPSLVRIRALEQYESLRTTIEELESVAGRLVTEGGAAADEALACTSKLLGEISDYVDVERLLVLPTVRNADIWGNLRANRMAKQHETQRDELEALEREQIRAIAPELLATDLLAFAKAMRESLEREEHEVLSTDLMRDDVVRPEAD